MCHNATQLTAHSLMHAMLFTVLTIVMVPHLQASDQAEMAAYSNENRGTSSTGEELRGRQNARLLGVLSEYLMHKNTLKIIQTSTAHMQGIRKSKHKSQKGIDAMIESERDEGNRTPSKPLKTKPTDDAASKVFVPST
ncbi:hypothetical protein CAPTEDRAFT_202277 [Capitella teleta]|uniref:Corticotropin-releasing factor domain-containing protein n=1 Tax=Capitella teleta TaxID=283909 RepID=R7TH16_CAPTE|nr:hypothetical protein CAPTEDRAFT_202277 [Capitella teleta]|eukprot:ELT90400.1 hypothetical protein CAPTEDRAFT_202277 [Capitella teleta]